MAARDAAIRIDAHPRKHVPAEAFNQRKTLSDLPGLIERAARLACGQPLDDLIDEAQALLDLVNAQPDAGIHITVLAQRHLKGELVIGRIGKRLARVEGAARGPADITPGAERSRKLRTKIQMPRPATPNASSPLKAEASAEIKARFYVKGWSLFAMFRSLVESVGCGFEGDKLGV